MASPKQMHRLARHDEVSSLSPFFDRAQRGNPPSYNEQLLQRSSYHLNPGFQGSTSRKNSLQATCVLRVSTQQLTCNPLHVYLRRIGS